jgi:hypothetical protein
MGGIYQVNSISPNERKVVYAPYEMDVVGRTQVDVNEARLVYLAAA